MTPRSRFRLSMPGLLLLPPTALYVPFYGAMALLFVLSVHDTTSFRMAEWQFSLENYRLALFDSYNADILVRTLGISVVIATSTTAIALPLALAIVRGRSRALRLGVALAVLLPFLLNALVRLFAWTTILSREGFLNMTLVALGLVEQPRSFLRTDFAVAVGLTYFLLPFAVVTITALLARLPRSLEHAAQTLGASEFDTFVRITLPMLRPALLASVVVTYSLSASAFVVPLILGGDQYKMYSNLIYDQAIFSGNHGLAAAMALVLLAVSLILIAGYRMVLRTPSRKSA